ncbi:uncharacterized protein LOC106153553 [Lingula anatina]|uniref:Uncharacterized protein LOC106153553 n=1 Tax=Lingula anatina TaxID=7574 RepID=A0A1S3HAE6_LINAN|nr:uncharacterized protein LOC106153553 [Lingula anatina]|eukprot:XP_013382983.1 uncharacterized protein LOC106153553 [Lingula anatina]
MGVRGLLSYCLCNQEQCVEYYDLIEEANRKGGLEILIDYYSFQQMILTNFWKSLRAVKHNPYLRLEGGEYSTLDAYLSKLVQDLQSLGIHMVFYIDGAKGSSYFSTQQKLETWKSRHYKELRTLKQLTDVCKGVMDIQALPDDVNVRPVLLEVQVLGTLKKCNCEIIQNSCGEADFVIAEGLIHRPKAFAVLSNDSDFCIMQNSRFIPNELFDLDNAIQLGQASLLPQKPISLKVGVITTERVLQLFGFRSHRLLVDLSIVNGNDFTAHYMKSLYNLLDVRGAKKVENFAGWMRHYKGIENHPILARELQYNPQFATAVMTSRQFYTLTAPPDRPTMKCPLSEYLEQAVQHGALPSNIMAMHSNFYWHRFLLEDSTPGLPCAEVALQSLRTFIYRMVLPRYENYVYEYGRTPDSDLKTIQVHAAHASLPPVSNIKPDRTFESLKLFHRIMMHQEPDFELNFFQRYGRKSGFIFCILRYFLVLNWGQNLYITPVEFLSVLATAFGWEHHKDQWYQNIAIRPSSRCVTIGNWFQALYRYAYNFLGQMLYLNQEFPPPHEIFAGARWTAFYMIMYPQDIYENPIAVPCDMLQTVELDRSKIIEEKKHMIRWLVQGCFPFRD